MCHKRAVFLIALVLLLPTLAVAGRGGEIVVFAGSASKPPLEEAAAIFRKETGIGVVLHLGGSGAMLNQLRLSRHGDVYIPGSPDFMEKARRLGVVRPESERILAYLVPAINVVRGNPKKISGLADLARPGLKIGMADPEGVCIGLYAVEILERSRLADGIRGNIAATVESCEKTAALIPLRAVDATLGWREFSSWNPQIESIPLAPGEVVRLGYIPGAVTVASAAPRESEAFLTFLGSERGRVIFRRWGYFTDEREARRFAPNALIGGEYTLPSGWR
jgi:molybdate transport system substrate-binding protein